MSISGRRKYWTDAETAELRRTYAVTPTHLLAARFKRREPSIYAKAKYLGLHKSFEYLRRPPAERISEKSMAKMGRKSRFQPEHVPWNKGLKGYKSPGRAAETQFKLGAKPVNCAPIGALRFASHGYWERKVCEATESQRCWKGEHILLWEECNGPVPQGHVVAFRNRDKSDIRIDNLELISRSELMSRNTIMQYPPELRGAVRSLKRLQKSIKDKNHEKQN